MTYAGNAKRTYTSDELAKEVLAMVDYQRARIKERGGFYDPSLHQSEVVLEFIEWAATVDGGAVLFEFLIESKRSKAEETVALIRAIAEGMKKMEGKSGNK